MHKPNKTHFLSNVLNFEEGPTISEVYNTMSIFNSVVPLFVSEIIESKNHRDNSIVLVSNADALKSLQDECSFKSLWCVIPGTLSNSGVLEVHELSEIEKSEIESDGDVTTIYRLKLNNGKLITYDLSETELPSEVLVFEPYLSHPVQERSH